MKKTFLNIFILLILAIIYSLIFYLQFTNRLSIDFNAFYSSLKKSNPYTGITNLNPPIFLLITKYLANYSKEYALIIWSLLSFTAGLLGTAISATFIFSNEFIKKYWSFFLLFYLLLFSTLMNIVIAQVGAFLLFFIMAGYYCYIHQRDTLAGILWGIITAIKFFPGLLFFLALQQKRYRVFYVMLATFIGLEFLPWFLEGRVIYQQYFHLMTFVYWYGDSWNASIYGFLIRILYAPAHQLKNVYLLYLVYGLILTTSILWFIKKISSYPHQNANHQPFALALALMLLLSPMGWLYYFSLLIVPFALSWQQLMQDYKLREKFIFCWSGSLFLLNVPLDYVRSSTMTSLPTRLSLYSIYFYGLSLLVYLLAKPFASSYKMHEIPKNNRFLLWLILAILLFGLTPPFIFYIQELRRVFF